MPAYRSGESRTLVKSTGQWVKNKKERAFDYDKINKKSWALLISFFRFYPDFLLDLLRAKNAQFGLELIQRVMLRVQARYNNSYITGARGITKTFIVMLSKTTDGVCYPGDTTRYYAPSQKQSAKLASSKFKEIRRNYPILASWWTVKNDREDMFYAVTNYGSEIAMYAPRGDSFSSLVGEEIAQEGSDGFNFEDFEEEVTKGHRDERLVNGKLDRTRVQLKENYISNASSRNNKAFSVYRSTALKLMLYGEKHEGFCMDVSWKTALLCNLRSIAYYKKEKAKTSPEVWAREMEVKYGGSSENPMIADETLAKSRKLTCAEFEHCGDPNAIYVVSYDVADEDGPNNAKCGLVVGKLTEYTTVSKQDEYQADIVYVDTFPPQKTYYQQAMDLKKVWRRFCMDGGQATYLIIDCAGGHGKSIVEKLMMATTDGSKPLSCINNYHSDLEQPNAVRCIYPMKAGTRGTVDPDGEMVENAQTNFSHDNVRLLIPRVLDGLEQYKLQHNIKDDSADGSIILPYKKTEELCGQIKNLKAVTSGTTKREERKTTRTPRDIWSALKYLLRWKWYLEQKLQKNRNKSKGGWDELISQYKNGQAHIPQATPMQGNRSRLISMRNITRR